MIEWKVLASSNIDAILDWERESLLRSSKDETEKLMAEWSAKWRRESLEHYLHMGWSMSAWSDQDGKKNLCGYFLAQPFLFFQGHTQVLWIEHLAADRSEVRGELIDIAYRMSREKHLQMVLFHGLRDREDFLRYKGVAFKEEWVEIPTTKRG